MWSWISSCCSASPRTIEGSSWVRRGPDQPAMQSSNKRIILPASKIDKIIADARAGQDLSRLAPNVAATVIKQATEEDLKYLTKAFKNYKLQEQFNDQTLHDRIVARHQQLKAQAPSSSSITPRIA